MVPGPAPALELRWTVERGPFEICANGDLWTMKIENFRFRFFLDFLDYLR